MIKVSILEDNHKVMGYEISGHAGYDEYGKDIVCSAVSFLAINTANAIETYCNNQMDVTMKEDGYLKIIILDELSNETSLLLNTFVLGINELEKQYGSKYINITFEEV